MLVILLTNLSMPPDKHQLMKRKLNENPGLKIKRDLRYDVTVKLFKSPLELQYFTSEEDEVIIEM